VVLDIRSQVDESPAFDARSARISSTGIWRTIRDNLGLFVFSIVPMTAFNFFSHGTQDLYPTFLQVQKHLSPHQVGAIAVIYDIRAILGGIGFGTLSEAIGRRRAIVIAALLALPVVPLWAYGSTPVLLALGAFLMQVAVQGAWGIKPAHLNELSPEEVRGTFPGFTCQLGNLLAPGNATLQAGIAAHYGGDYAFALAVVAVVIAIAVALLAGLWPRSARRAFRRTSAAPRRIKRKPGISAGLPLAIEGGPTFSPRPPLSAYPSCRRRCSAPCRPPGPPYLRLAAWYRRSPCRRFPSLFPWPASGCLQCGPYPLFCPRCLIGSTEPTSGHRWRSSPNRYRDEICIQRNVSFDIAGAP
jgi:MFS family permease